MKEQNDTNLMLCKKCGKVSNWVSYFGDQYKRHCPWCGWLQEDEYTMIADKQSLSQNSGDENGK